MPLKLSVRRVDPAEAEKLLEQTVAHARVDDRMLLAYARDMSQGRWILNGSPLIVAQDGRLLDGRVRLLACVRSRAPFTTLMVEGVAADALEQSMRCGSAP